MYILEKQEEEIIELPVLNITADNSISVCSENNICASNIEVEYD